MKKQKKKVYFWLKLDQNFFKNLAIKQALRMPGGKDMIIVYQMLMLESLATGGVIYYEEMLAMISLYYHGAPWAKLEAKKWLQKVVE